MAASRMPFDLSMGERSSRTARPRDADAPMRLLLLADLGASAAPPLAQRRPLAVDIDTMAPLFKRLAPALTLDVDGQAVELRFASLDDFHPEALLARLPLFDALRRLRAELDDPRQFARAAAAMGWPGGANPSAAVPTSAPTPAPNQAGTDANADMERLLGRRPAGLAPAAPSADDALQGWLRQMLAPHVLPDVAHEQRALRAAADAAIADLMRRLLHHPRWQALEAAWRGIDGLVRGLELGETLHLHVLHATPAEVGADLAAHAADLSASALHRLFCEAQGADATGWGRIVLDRAFGPDAEPVHTLAALGALAARAGAPLLAAATPQALGCSSVAQLAEPRRWLAADDPALAHWAALRASPMAEWITLALPRVLLRLPYGAATDPVSGFDFEELPAPIDHEAYLWGNASLALALLTGRAFLQDGWAMDLADQCVLDDLPSHVVTVDGERAQQPCAEVLLPEPAVQAIAARGPMPLVSWRDRPAAQFIGWHSLADRA